MKILKQIEEILVFCGCLDHLHLTRLAHLPWLILQPSVASTTIFYESSIEPLAPSTEHIHCEKFS
jgi:hypothetical protein